MGSEEFRFIYTDDEETARSYYTGNSNLFNYKGKLGLHEYSAEDWLMFWVLEDAENHKWSKHLYEPSPLGGNMIRYSSFVGMTGTGEFVWWSSYDNSPPRSLYFTFYNLESGTFRKVNIQGFDDLKQHRSIWITTYLDYVENVKWPM